MKRFDASIARTEMRILATAIKRAERAHDYENNHYDDNAMRYNELKQQLQKHNAQIIDYLNM